MNGADALASLHGCRMVLCVSSDERVLTDLREHGVPAMALRAELTPRRLRHFRHRFDGAVCDLAPFGGSLPPDVEAAFAHSLVPGGRLLLLGGTAATASAAGFVRDDAGVWRTPSLATGPNAALGPRVGPFADLLVGCRRVLEVGTGSGRFLDALHLRGIETRGLETDGACAAAARTRGHTVHQGSLADLPRAANRADGMFVGNWLGALDPDAAARVLAACRHVLPHGGRLLVRCAPAAAPALTRLLTHGSWTPVHRAPVPHDGDLALVAIAAGDRPPLPDDLATIRFGGASGPLEQPPRTFFDLERTERQVTSQGGEDGVLAELFARLGTTNRHYVEFGCGDGLQCNTTQLRRAGWRGLLMDGVAAPAAADAVIHAAWITADNIESLLDRHGVPAEPDLLSVDVDGNDYWIWRAIRRRPRVVVIEYNANLPADRALSIPYDPGHRWDGSDFYGASLLALAQLGEAKGYTLVYCSQAGVNAFFVRDDVLPAGTDRIDVRALYRPPNYWYRGYRSRPDLTRAMCTVGPALPVPVR